MLISDTQSMRGGMINSSNPQTRLDPKYFQSHQTIISDSKPTALLKTNGIRINKQLVSGSAPAGSQPQVLQQHNVNGSANGLTGSSNMPSLASAYFPSS